MQDLTSTFIFMGIMVFIFYFMLIRPQKKRQEAHRRVVESVRVGDEVMTSGGMYGTVRSVDEETLDIEVAPGTTVRFVKQAIARRVTDDIGTTSEEDTT